MEQKIMNGKSIAYLGSGFAALAAELYLKRLGAFDDREFLCGMLLSAAILLLLHGICFAAGDFAKYCQKDKTSGDNQ